MSPPSFLISLDFDGTLSLADRNPSVDPAIHAALAAWRKRGACWMINTGRSLAHTLEGLEEGAFPDPPDFLITRERDIYVPNALGRWQAFGDWNARSDAAHTELFHEASALLDDVRKFLEYETLATFFDVPEEPAGIISSSDEEMDQICAFIDPMLSAFPDLRYERNSIYLRFSHRAFNKGSALAHLSMALGVAPSRIFAAGDNYNDLTMLDPRIAAHLACPANALPQVHSHIAAHGGYRARLPGAAGIAEALLRLHAQPLSDSNLSH